MFLKRLTAYIIDYLIHSVLFMIVTMIIVAASFNNLYPDSPFLIILLVYRPLTFFYDLLNNYSLGKDVSWIYTAIVVILSLKILVYSLEEFLYGGQSLGKRILKIRIKFEDNKKDIRKIFLRNILKVISLFLFGIPFFVMVFTNKRQTLYDIILKTDVIKNS